MGKTAGTVKREAYRAVRACAAALITALALALVFGAPGPAGAEMVRYWAHDSAGVTSPSDTWYLAEGCTGSGFLAIVTRPP